MEQYSCALIIAPDGVAFTPVKEVSARATFQFLGALRPHFGVYNHQITTRNSRVLKPKCVRNLRTQFVIYERNLENCILADINVISRTEGNPLISQVTLTDY